MRIEISHRSEYSYDADGGTTVQALRLTPPGGGSQTIEQWRIEAPGLEEAASYNDAYGNRVHLIASGGQTGPLVVAAQGVVVTTDTAGVVGWTGEAATPAIYLRETLRTAPSAGIRALAEAVREVRDGSLAETATLHALMERIHAEVDYRISSTDAGTSAAAAYEGKLGVCQDHAHIFISAARCLGIPARYTTGYLLTESADADAAHHAWAEALLPGIGWTGFDPANNTCPTDRYIRLAVGLDAGIAAPIRGVRRGPGSETLVVTVAVRQASQQLSQ